MAITKTNFINYTRCNRYAALDEVHQEKLEADISYTEYKKEEEQDIIKELLSGMYQDEEMEIDLTKKENKQLQAMLPFYKKVEIEAGKILNLIKGVLNIFVM